MTFSAEFSPIFINNQLLPFSEIAINLLLKLKSRDGIDIKVPCSIKHCNSLPQLTTLFKLINLNFLISILWFFIAFKVVSLDLNYAFKRSLHGPSRLLIIFEVFSSTEILFLLQHN